MRQLLLIVFNHDRPVKSESAAQNTDKAFQRTRKKAVRR